MVDKVIEGATPSADGGANVALVAGVRERAAPEVEWRIKFLPEGISFRRFVGGDCDESYRFVDRRVAAIWAASIIQGFEPPRHLRESDIPVG